MSTAPSDILHVERRGAAEWITLNRPDRLNALTIDMVDALADHFTALVPDTDVRVVVLRGAGRAFCAGLDVKEGGATLVAGGAAMMAMQRRFSRVTLAMRRCPQPIVGLLHGATVGAGFAYALATDIRLAGQSFRANCAFIKIGFSGGDCGSSYLLPKAVGSSVARELLLTGRFIDADRALRVGLVSEVVADDDLEAAGEGLVADLLATAPLGLRLTKELCNAEEAGNAIEDQIALEDRSQVLTSLVGDPLEGMKAFVQKRDPQFAP